jgi:hypothetical protein
VEAPEPSEAPEVYDDAQRSHLYWLDLRVCRTKANCTVAVNRNLSVQAKLNK